MSEHSRIWPLQEAKAKFSKLVKLAQSDGPQEVTVHGKYAVTIACLPQDKAKESGLTGADLVKALRSGPHFDIDIPPRPKDGKSRDFSFE